MNSRSSNWIYSPALDLVIGCGGWTLPLLLFAYPAGGANLPTLAAAFYALALIFNYPHYMATIYRAYHTREDFERYRIFTVYTTGLLLMTLVAAHWFYWVVPILFTIYITWSPWHYMGQNFGLLMMFLRRTGVQIDSKDRNALRTSFVASYVMIFLTFHTNPSSDPYVLSLGLPGLLDVLRLPMLAIFAVLGIYPLVKLVRKIGWRPMIPPIALYVTEFLWFCLPTVLELTTSLRLPQARYSAGILAVMHSAQYIWITSFYAKKEAQTAGRTAWKWPVYFGTLAVGGIALFIPGPWVASYLFKRDFSSSVLIFTALINIHHFILDGAVWKLREKRVASMLVEGGATASPRAVLPWTIQLGPLMKFAKPAAIGVLVLIAGLDQVRYYLGIQNQNSSSLALAASLNPYDAALQNRLGRSYAVAGQPDKTERSLRQSIRINPFNADTQNALAQLLVDQQRYADAYEHYKQMFSRLDPSPAALVNFGVLCTMRSQRVEAHQAFERAIQKSPGYAPAHLYLGELIQAEGKTQDAVAHYTRCVSMATTAGNTELASTCELRARELHR